MDKNTKKPDEKNSDRKALTWKERMNPEIAGLRWDLPPYKKEDARKGNKRD